MKNRYFISILLFIFFVSFTHIQLSSWAQEDKPEVDNLDWLFNDDIFKDEQDRQDIIPQQIQKKPEQKPIRKEIAILGALDKITTRMSKLEIPVNSSKEFYSLDIFVHSCQEASPQDKPESASFLEVRERKKGEALPVPVFKGWMFASSPSLSAMDHHVYDVWVIGCKSLPTAENSSSPKPETSENE